MPDFHKIYSSEGQRYDVLIGHEDFQGNLKKKIFDLVDIDGKTIVEFGAGTGRLTFLLAPYAKQIFAFDKFENMLDLAQRKLKESELKNITFILSDNESLPVNDTAADVTVEAWSFCHSLRDHRDDYKNYVEVLMNEMNRVTKPGGDIILIETLGTNVEKPMYVNEWLEFFFKFLENRLGFQKQIINTDYFFENVRQAHKIADFFFGPELLLKKTSEGVIMPEFTGIWWGQKK